MIESVEAVETHSKKHDDFDNVFFAQEEKLKVHIIFSFDNFCSQKKEALLSHEFLFYSEL